jgi:predicted O-methyltransferase YrrM
MIALMELLEHLADQGFEIREGSSSEILLAYLAYLAQQPGVSMIVETGFNAGLSSQAFLTANEDAHVVSFDMLHDWGDAAKTYIDEHFPGRHELIRGDSKEQVPRYIDANPGVQFDVLFIDGGHDFRTARADLANFRRLARPGAVVVMDDLIPRYNWGRGPYLAWKEQLLKRTVHQAALLREARIGERPPNICAIGNYVGI